MKTLVVFAFLSICVAAGNARAQAATAAPLPCGTTPVGYTLRWKAATTGGAPAGYRVYRRTDPAVPFSKLVGYDVLMGTTNADGSISAFVPNFDPSIRTYVSMRAYNEGGESPQSNEIAMDAVTSGACPPPPGAPELLSLALDQKRELDQKSEALGQTLRTLQDQMTGPPVPKATSSRAKPAK